MNLNKIAKAKKICYEFVYSRRPIPTDTTTIRMSPDKTEFFLPKESSREPAIGAKIMIPKENAPAMIPVSTEVISG
jgi:hypothetical protein